MLPLNLSHGRDCIASLFTNIGIFLQTQPLHRYAKLGLDFNDALMNFTVIGIN